MSAIVLGFVVFFALLFAGFAAWLVMSVRSWWHARKGNRPGAPDPAGRNGDTLEGEFEVLGGKRGSQDRGTDHE